MPENKYYFLRFKFGKNSFQEVTTQYPLLFISEWARKNFCNTNSCKNIWFTEIPEIVYKEFVSEDAED